MVYHNTIQELELEKNVILLYYQIIIQIYFNFMQGENDWILERVKSNKTKSDEENEDGQDVIILVHL